MKKKRLTIVTILLVIAITVGGLFVHINNSNKATIFVATDTHYLSSRINDKGEAFERMIAESDGKLIQSCEEIIDTFSDEVISQKPDVLILSGDLTFNGEKASHEDLTKKLKKIQDSGVQVLTIAGNHDIDSKRSGQYIKDEVIATDNVSAEEFKELYFDFGMAQAESVDTYSLSYTYKVNNKLYVLMLDTNAFGQNFVQDESYEWIESQLKKINESGAQVITVSHQNLFAHNDQLSFGYQLYDADELLELYNKYKVKLNLSGHIHMQHIKTDGITEIATSSLLVSPIQYGVLEIGKSIDYHTKKINVKSIDNFEKYAEDCFKDSGINKSMQMLNETDLSEADKKEIATTFAELNASYFAGTKIDTTPYKNGIDLISKQDGFMQKYIQTMVDEAQNDYTKTSIE